MKIILMLALLSASMPSLAADDVNGKWVERAKIAAIKLVGLKKKMGVDTKASYEYLLEYAFSLQTDENNKDLVHKTDNGIDFYKIMFKSSKAEAKKDPLFVINYMYESESGKFIGTKIEMLPKKWYLIQDSSDSSLLILDLNDAGFVISFNLDDPFKTVVAKL